MSYRARVFGAIALVVLALVAALYLSWKLEPPPGENVPHRQAGSEPAPTAPAEHHAEELPPEAFDRTPLRGRPGQAGRRAWPARVGSTIAMPWKTNRVYVADEDHRALRVIQTGRNAPDPQRVDMPGAPAQVVIVPGDQERVLVTVRDPGLLLIFDPEGETDLVERGRVELPADAWGVAVSEDGKTALVSSAWTHQVSAVDLETATKRWSVDVAREPRGIVVSEEGVAYVTHLVGVAITRIDDIAGEQPRVSRVDVPACPLRTPSGTALDASLGYAAVLSGDESRLYVARHALGAMGDKAWFGAATVDVLLTANDTPLAPKHSGRAPFYRVDNNPRADVLAVAGGPLAPFAEPRAMVVRRSKSTLLVAGEGNDVVVELDALAVDPTLAVLHTYKLGDDYGEAIPVAGTCAAPSGLALNIYEDTLVVFCRGTYDVVWVGLEGRDDQVGVKRVRHLADDTLDKDTAIGRRIFYNATDAITSGGVACAGCHPEGRDDGHVWHEVRLNTDDGTHVNFVGVAENVPDEDRAKGVPRRTPMLAGRVSARGPYGWHGESPDLIHRLKNGFALHRWGGLPKHEPVNLEARATLLTAFLRKGLVPPPRDEHELTEEEARGKKVFTSDAAKCSSCHAPETGYTDRLAYPLPKLPKLDDFDDEARPDFKTPSLLFVAGRAPYFHDGSAKSLEELVEKNADRMGKTKQLSSEDRAALVAFLRTL